MDTLDKITILLKEQHRNQSELCAYIGVKKNAYTNWKNGHTTSYLKHLPKIAEFLGVSVDYLIGKTDKKRADTDGLPLTEQQQKLFDAASDLPDDDIRQALEYIELLKLKRNQKPE